MTNITWPDGKKFAFTIFDDTDRTTIHNGPPIYDILADLGFRTTKSVWPLKGASKPAIGGSTCQDPEYLAWVKSLQSRGFEIALHNVTYHTSDRSTVIEGFERFHEYFGSYPHIHVNHGDCQENIYWGDARFTRMNRALYNLLSNHERQNRFKGHVQGSKLFWGDICLERIDFVRNFTFLDINTLKVCPYMPYYDPERPFVKNWFASTDGANGDRFIEKISEENQDRLEEEGGACIMYTHFGSRFINDGQMQPLFKQRMERLSKKNGWFVPVSTLLDYLLSVKGQHVLSDRERSHLERTWLRDQIIRKLR